MDESKVDNDLIEENNARKMGKTKEYWEDRADMKGEEVS